MRNHGKNAVFRLAAVFAVALAPAMASAADCGDMNDDSRVNIQDVLIMAQCVAGNCPGGDGAQCGDAGLADCADTFGDGATVDTSDLNQLVFAVAGLETLHDLCADTTPVLAGCPGPVVLGSQTISSSITWPTPCTVQLDGTVFVETPAEGPPTVLTIQEGVEVQGVKGSDDPAALIFLPDAKISAIGTPSDPIVFTSDQADESRSKGDWAGLMFNGRSTVNRPNCLAAAEGIPSSFGGCETNDSSGIARYLRVEYAGLDFTPNNELNLFTMNGLGSGTDFSYIQAHVGDDDCLEWFGGTLDTHHMVATACGDDGFDYQLGFTGSVQYGLMVQNGNLTDTGRDSRGMEGDNSEFGNDDLPRSKPRMCNMTFIGGDQNTGANDGSDTGMLTRRGSAGLFGNVIVAYFGDAGMELREDATGANACNDDGDLIPESLTGELEYFAGVFYSNGSGGVEHAKSGGSSQPGVGCDSEGFYEFLASAGQVTANGANPVSGMALDTEWPADGDLYDAVPASLAGAPAAADCTEISDVFEDSGYIGAMDPSGPAFGWLSQPWISFDPD